MIVGDARAHPKMISAGKLKSSRMYPAPKKDDGNI